MGTYYKNIEQFIDHIDDGDWIEIGIDRGEGSTKFFADLCKERSVHFYGVDMDPVQISTAESTLSVNGKLPDHVSIHHARGEEFLQNLRNQNKDARISLAYLDNFDWDYWLGRQEESFVSGVKKRYIDLLNLEMTNINSQQTHLLQALYLLPMMTANSLIVCDDTWFHPHEGIFIGKCSAVIPYLLLNGYSVLHYHGYRQNSGAILGRFQS